MGPASSIEPYGITHYFLVTEPWWDFPGGEAAYQEHPDSREPRQYVGSLDHRPGLCKPWVNLITSQNHGIHIYTLATIRQTHRAPVYSRWKT